MRAQSLSDPPTKTKARRCKNGRKKRKLLISGKGRSPYLLTEDFRGVPYTTNDTKTASVRHSSCELGPSGNIHAIMYWISKEVHRTTPMTTHPASKMGCLMPKSSVMGVWIIAIVVGGITYDGQVEEGEGEASARRD